MAHCSGYLSERARASDLVFGSCQSQFRPRIRSWQDHDKNQTEMSSWNRLKIILQNKTIFTRLNIAFDASIQQLARV